MTAQAPPFLSGYVSPQSAPLGRYQPPVQGGVASAWLKSHLEPGSWIIEPFCASPELVLEAAHAGYRVLAVANNPITRFLLELHARPPQENELRAALADLAASLKGSERVEPHIRSLYLTECAQCGRSVEAQAFIWERDAPAPAARLYHCPACGDQGEHPATQADAERAAHFSAHGLQRVRALERITPLNDPDRVYAEEALNMYLPRAIYVLFTLVNQLDRFAAPRRRLLETLLLAAFDQASILWPVAAARLRPRQLTPPARFLEKNIWLSLEQAISAWATLTDASEAPCGCPIVPWPSAPPSSGGICLFEGRLKDLAAASQLSWPEGLNIGAAVCAMPRPNRAYWTLSALWAAWLWGQPASQAFKSVLRRKRYDWSWHTEALYAADNHLFRLLEAGCPWLGLAAEAETGLMGASLLAGLYAGFELEGLALRSEDDQAQIHWRRLPQPPTPPVIQTSAGLQNFARQAARRFLAERGEPAPYLAIYCAVLQELTRTPGLALPPASAIGEAYRLIDDALQASLAQDETFIYYGGVARLAGMRMRDNDLWWSEASPQKEAPAMALADRVEIEIVRFLISQTTCRLEEIDLAVRQAFTGLMTPEFELVRACVHSYGKETQPGSGQWRLREEDAPTARRSDLAEMRRLLVEIGLRLGFEVDQEHKETDELAGAITWRSSHAPPYRFYPIASGVLSKIALDPGRAGREEKTASPTQRKPRQIIVLPAGRAALVSYKLEHNPRLRSEIESAWLLLKYRHVRRLAAHAALTSENLDEQLALDPLSNRDPQIALL